MYDIISVGSATRDVFLKSKSLERFLKWESGKEVLSLPLGSKNEIDNIYLSTGGGATNTAVFFARQKIRTACIVRVGSDSSGEDILKDLLSEGVSCEFLQKDKEPKTAYSTIITVKDGSRAVFVRRGVSGNLNLNDIDFSRLKTKWFYISSISGNLDLLSGLVSHAKKNNIKIAFNPGSSELKFGLSKLEEFLKNIDIFIVNETEALFLLSKKEYDEKYLFKNLKKAVKGIVVITKGADGVVVSDGKYIYKAGIPNSDIVERTGAGDAFGSAFTLSILRGDTIENAIQFATANSTSVVQYYSAKTGLLRKGDWGPWTRVDVKKEVIN